MHRERIIALFLVLYIAFAGGAHTPRFIREPLRPLIGKLIAAALLVGLYVKQVVSPSIVFLIAIALLRSAPNGLEFYTEKPPGKYVKDPRAPHTDTESDLIHPTIDAGRVH